MVDQNNKVVIPFNYSFIGERIYEGLLRVNQGANEVFGPVGGKWGVIDLSGNIVVPLQYDQLNNFSEGFAQVALGGEFKGLFYEGWKWSFIDKTGKLLTPIKYDKVENFIRNYAKVNIGGAYQGLSFVGGKWGIIDKTGKEVIPVEYDEVGWVKSDGSVKVKQKGQEIDLLIKGNQ
jgi:hypothetical protein